MCDWCKQQTFQENIKNYCVSCGDKIEGLFKDYIKQGNYCDACNIKAGKNAKFGGSLLANLLIN